MSESESLGRRWFLRLQSAYVLPLARGIYVLIALGCLLAVIAGALYLVYLQTSIAGGPTSNPLPPPYQGSLKSIDRSDRVVDIDTVGSRLEPPANIRFAVSAGTITEPLEKGALIGRFVADTRNSLAPYPEGVSLLGGRDAELFERVRDRRNQAVGLAARPALVDEITKVLSGLDEETTRSFEVRVVARDKYGIASPPTDLSFELKLAPKPAAPATPQESAQAATELQKIARDIAQTIEPEVNPAHFKAYQAALKVPKRCGSSETDESFLANYRRAVQELRPRLNASNVEAFYTGLCDAWRVVLEREGAELERLRAEQSAARRAAEEARARVQARNDEMFEAHQTKVFAAKAKTAVTLSVIGGALAIFLSVALVLAFLAIEGHSRAVRAAIESLVDRNQGNEANGSVAETS